MAAADQKCCMVYSVYMFKMTSDRLSLHHNTVKFPFEIGPLHLKVMYMPYACANNYLYVFVAVLSSVSNSLLHFSAGIFEHHNMDLCTPVIYRRRRVI